MTAAFSPELVEIHSGNARAIIDPRGAVLHEYRNGGVALTEPGSARTKWLASGDTMFPWPIRVRDGRWAYQGEDHQLEITEPAFNNAIHGLVQDVVFTVQLRAENTVTLAARVDQAPGYPFTLTLEVQYSLLPDGLTVTYRVTNHGETVAPFGIGAHPYLCVGDVPVDRLSVRIPARQFAVEDEQLIPVSRERVDGSTYDFSRGRSIAGWRGSVAYTGFGGKAVCALLDEAGRGSELWADPEFAWVQFFVTDGFGSDPSGTGGKAAVAIEPLTCAVDALNSGDGIIALDPGECWSGSWGIHPVGW